MNILDVGSLQTMFSSASELAESAIAINNEEINLSTLTYMSELMYAMGRVTPVVFTLVEYRDWFGDSAYDHITVERKDETHYIATFHADFTEDVCNAYGVAPVLERTAVGQNYEESRNRVVIELMNWIESLKCKNQSPTHFKIDFKNVYKKFNEKTHSDTIKTVLDSDTDDGFVKSTNGCDGNCHDCTHEDV